MSDYHYTLTEDMLCLQRWETVAVTESRYAQDSYSQTPFVLIQELRGTRSRPLNHDLLRRLVEDPCKVGFPEEYEAEWPFETRVVVAEDTGWYQFVAYEDGTDEVRREAKRLLGESA